MKVLLGISGSSSVNLGLKLLKNLENQCELYCILTQGAKLSFKAENQANLEYKINYGMNYFPEKEYKGVTYEEGEYESLVITLGNGLGENFWCVLFPPLCLLEADEEETEEVEYTSFVKEIIDKYF